MKKYLVALIAIILCSVLAQAQTATRRAGTSGNAAASSAVGSSAVIPGQLNEDNSLWLIDLDKGGIDLSDDKQINTFSTSYLSFKAAYYLPYFWPLKIPQMDSGPGIRLKFGLAIDYLSGKSFLSDSLSNQIYGEKASRVFIGLSAKMIFGYRSIRDYINIDADGTEHEGKDTTQIVNSELTVNFGPAPVSGVNIHTPYFSDTRRLIDFMLSVVYEFKVGRNLNKTWFPAFKAEMTASLFTSQDTKQLSSSLPISWGLDPNTLVNAVSYHGLNCPSLHIALRQDLVDLKWFGAGSRIPLGYTIIADRYWGDPQSVSNYGLGFTTDLLVILPHNYNFESFVSFEVVKNWGAQSGTTMRFVIHWSTGARVWWYSIVGGN